MVHIAFSCCQADYALVFAWGCAVLLCGDLQLYNTSTGKRIDFIIPAIVFHGIVPCVAITSSLYLLASM